MSVSMINFVKYENERHNQTDKSVGMLIINLTTSMGGLGAVVEAVRNGKKSETKTVIELLNVMKTSGLLYNKLKRDLKLSTDVSYYNLVKNNYETIKKNFTGMDKVWIFFRMLQYLGELNEKFHIRTQAHEYQYLMKSLSEFQTYLLMYIELALKDSGSTINVDGKKIEIIHNDTTNENTTPLQEGVQTPIVKDNKPVKPVKPAKKTTKGKNESKKPGKATKTTVTKKQTVESDKPPLPDAGFLKKIMERMNPSSDGKKVDEVDEETKQKLIRGEM